MDHVTLTAVFELVDDGWVQARVAELPAVITVGRTRSEARELLIDALREYLLADSGEMELPSGADLEQIQVELRIPAATDGETVSRSRWPM